MRTHFAILCLSLLPAGAFAATIHVPADYPTVFEALDAAVSGDVVEVAPGEYSDFDIRSDHFGNSIATMGQLKPGVTLRSSGGAAVTTLRLPSVPPTTIPIVLLFDDTGSVSVQGFTLTGDGQDTDCFIASPPVPAASSVLVENCTFENTGGIYDAMWAESADVTLRGCTFRNLGGSVWLEVQGHTVAVEDCDFENNAVAEGLTIYSRHAVVRDSRFRGMTVSAMFGNASEDVLLESCTFSDNAWADISSAGTTTARGSTFIRTGLVVDAGGTGEVSGNTFYGGEVQVPLLEAHHDYGPWDLVVRKNIFAYAASGGSEAIITYDLVQVQSECNDFWANAGGNAGYALDPTDIELDPQFCDRLADDLRLFVSSPCLETNNPSCGQIGSMGLGCGPVAVQPVSWGRVKQLYR